MGYYRLMVERDVERALAEFDRAARALPETAEVLEARGLGYRQRGDWLAALDEFKSACRLSPRDSSPLVELVFTYWILRRYPEAREAANRAIEISPDRPWPYLSKALTYFSWRGASGESREAIELVPQDHEWYSWMWFWQLVYEKKYQDALDYLSSLRENWIRIKIDAKPIAMYRAYVHEMLGQSEAAKTAYETAAALLEAEVDARPADPRYHSSLGIAYAALGRSENAIREGKRAISLLPLSKDALYGQTCVIDMSHIYTLLGDYDSALESLRGQLSSPGMVSVPLLEVDPRWMRLRGVPGFRQLLDEFRPTPSPDS
jgi:tetratricopeptide (TPR) repeat protein